MDTTAVPYNLLVVSDLHLSEGRDSDDKKFSKNEDFFFDEEFARFLAYYQDGRRWRGAKFHLIINGDFVDFLQVINVANAPSVGRPGKERPDLGLPCGEQESVCKLEKVVQGHWRFFEALAGFVAAGNILTIIKGNHDVEFHYPAVRAAFLRELQAVFGTRLSEDKAWGDEKDIGSLNGNTVRFSDWFYFERDLLWIEHGNRYEPLNSFKYWLAPLLPKIPNCPAARQNDIDLPFGSLFVRYLFNRIEQRVPFADNIKPATRFISWLIRKHAWTALRFVFRDGQYMLAKVCRAWANVSAHAWEHRKQQHDARLVQLANESGISPSKLVGLDRLRERSVLKEPNRCDKVWRFVLGPRRFYLSIVLIGIALAVAILYGAANLLANMTPDVIRERVFDPLVALVRPVASWGVCFLFGVLAALGLLRWRCRRENKQQQPSSLKDKAAAIASSDLLGVQYVFMGHTHDPELHVVGKDGGQEKEYFNTGTWTTVFSEEERLIRKPLEFVFVQGVRKGNGLEAKLLEWNDGANEPRLLKLFRDENVAKR